MIVLTTGGRTYKDYKTVERVLGTLKPTLTIHGGAEGADTLVGRWAEDSFGSGYSTGYGHAAYDLGSGTSSSTGDGTQGLTGLGWGYGFTYGGNFNGSGSRPGRPTSDYAAATAAWRNLVSRLCGAEGPWGGGVMMEGNEEGH